VAVVTHQGAPASPSAVTVAQRLADLRARIAASGGDVDAVRIVAVTKGFPASAVADAAGVGLLDVGENYARPLLDKIAALGAAGDGLAADVRWHFLGAVQRNKVARLAPHVALWQGVDRVAAGEEIARRAPGATVLVQVNLTGEPGRNGCSWVDAPATVDALRRLDLDVAGLMGVASRHRTEAAAQFARLRELRDALGVRELSIGMTDDLDLAVAAGATMVRAGRALFGARPGAAEVRR
ncbi:MAG TPA: alanine racemase, partial [Acidimicrobiales bacterium]